jgi:bifunctional DNA-binding transcriptional regulator/antitoxin component of YhaV-PrlF toxin-antitoxin module
MEDCRMGWVRVTVDAEGGLVLPEEIRQSLGIADGGTLDLQVQGSELRAVTWEARLKRVRELIPAWKPGDPLWSEELIAERRAEAQRDLAEDERDAAQRGKLP